jgi:hypothetical protein
MQRYSVGFMKALLLFLVVCTVTLLILAEDREGGTTTNRPSRAGPYVSTRVRMMLGGKWRSLEDLRGTAQQIIDRNTANVPWGDLKEAGAWIDSQEPTNYVTFHFSFGLGKQSFVVSFGRDGRLYQFNEGIAMESVGKPGYQDFPPNREK